jgi:outer membrane protein OmpA-like peptidoglycan-associated protein
LDCQNTDNGSGINLDLPLIPSTGLASHPTLKEDSFRDMFESGFLIELGGIYYDFDQFKLLPQSMAELDKVVELMLRQPDLFVQVRSHTDSRGDDEYNHYLSSNRANAVAAYLVLNGIEVNRVSAKGFGEEQPVNGCTDGTECTEEEHQLNRRTELKLFKK